MTRRIDTVLRPLESTDPFLQRALAVKKDDEVVDRLHYFYTTNFLIAMSILVMPIFLVLCLLEGWSPHAVPLVTLIAFIVMVVISQLLLFIRRGPPAEREGEQAPP